METVAALAFWPFRSCALACLIKTEEEWTGRPRPLTNSPSHFKKVNVMRKARQPFHRTPPSGGSHRRHMPVEVVMKGQLRGE